MPLLHARSGSRSLSGPILLVSIAMSAGCAGPLTKSILVSNDVQEDAETQLLVRNILRARDHLPMHFTAISQVRVAPDGFGLGTPSLAATIPFGGPGAGYALTPSLTAPSSVDTTPLTSQEFYQGITKPLTGSVMAYYLEQGWPRDLVLNLFIQSIVYTDKSGLIGRLENRGDASQTGFDRIIEQILKCEIVEETDTDFTMYGSSRDQAEYKDLTALADAKTADLIPIPTDDLGNVVKEDAWHKLEPERRRVAFGAVTEYPGFRFVKGPSGTPTQDCSLLTLNSKQVEGRSGEALNFSAASTTFQSDARQTKYKPLSNSVVPPKLDARKSGPDKSKTKVDSQPDSEPDPKVRFILRSPEGMLRYLGRLSEPCPGSATHTNTDTSCRTPAQNRLFQTSTTKMTYPAITVDYSDGPYYIAPYERDKDRSVQALALVMQLLALQNKGTQAPATTNVRVLR